MYTVEQKIYNIFKSPTYIYKADVVILTNSGKLEKRIIGKNKDNLITIDNEYIPINTINRITIITMNFFICFFSLLLFVLLYIIFFILPYFIKFF